MNKVEFDNFSKNYNDLLQSQHKNMGDISYYSKYKVDILTTIVKKESKLNILEFGCGIGRNLPFLENCFKNSSIYGFDISSKSLDIASNANPNIDFLNSSDLDNYKNFFDLIFIAGVYHHIPTKERTDVSKQIYNLLNIHGKVVVFEHNPYNPITMKMVNTCEFDRDAVVLRKKELINIFLKNNFSYEKSSYTLFLPPKLKMFSFIEKYLSWFPLGGQYYIVIKKC